MKTRILHTKFWKDRFICSLTPVEKLLFNYFITNEYVNIIHIYELRDEQIILDTGIDRGILERCKEKFEKAKKIFFKDGFVCLRNACKYESYTGDKNNECRIRLLRQLGQELSDYFNTRIDTPMYRDYNTEIRNHKSEVINQKEEIRRKLLLDGLNKQKEDK
jgi:hypothetical protein